MDYIDTMKRRLSTVIGKGRDKMSQMNLAEIMGIDCARIHQLLHGTRGEKNCWIHYKASGEWVGSTLTTHRIITKITYNDKNGGLKTIERKT